MNTEEDNFHLLYITGLIYPVSVAGTAQNRMMVMYRGPGAGMYAVNESSLPTAMHQHDREPTMIPICFYLWFMIVEHI